MLQATPFFQEYMTSKKTAQSPTISFYMIVLVKKFKIYYIIKNIYHSKFNNTIL